MSWRIYTKTDLPNLLAFLKGEEWKCVALSSRIKDAIGRPFANVEMHSFLVNEKKVKGSPTILEAIMLTRYGLILPLLRDELTLTLGHNRPFMALLNRYKSRLHSVMGPSKGVLKIERLLGINPNARIEYHLMTRDLTDFRVSRAPAPRNVKIRLAHPEDADILYHLQKDYEIEEVFLDPSHFNERRCRSLLRKNLKKQIVFIALEGKRPIAKAGTNARGYGVDQLGGVYTTADKRNQGIAGYVLEALLDYLSVEKSMVCLFVKKTNPAALALYKRLNFQLKQSFRITYYTGI